jgi:hypothetical protein
LDGKKEREREREEKKKNRERNLLKHKHLKKYLCMLMKQIFFIGYSH